MKDFIQDFKAFAIKGNVVDLAVAVIIGTAFGKIVSSLVDTIIMPVIGIFLGGINFSGLSVHFDDITLRYGVFLQSIVDFFIIAFVIYLAVRIIGRFRRTQSTVVEEKSPAMSDEVKLLTEIRDLLRGSREG
jgi:large conductance mechanosensitive channel